MDSMALLVRSKSYLFSLVSCFILVLCIFFSGFIGYAQKLKINTEFGLQKNSMDWSICGKDQTNTLSSLKWREVKLNRYGFAMNYRLNNYFTLESTVSLMSTHSGNVRDIDYSEQYPYNIISDAEYSARKGSAIELAIDVQYSLVNSENQKNYLRLVSGFYSYAQHFSLLGSVYAKDDLNSYYRNRWKGATAGIIGKLTAGRFSFIEKVDIGLLIYRARANWNLIEEFSHPTSFKHNANGYMYALGTSISYRLCKGVHVLYRFSIRNMKTWQGEDRLFYKNGTVSYSRLNEVNQSDCYNNIGASFVL